MSSRRLAFGPFLLDPANRRLTRNGQPLELSSRYFDALVLLVSEPGELVRKERFLGEVWKGVPVTDEVLSQCIKTLRKQLGDRAKDPRFIETVPKHGYRFIATVEAARPSEHQGTPATATPAPPSKQTHDFLQLVTAGTLGGGLAGVLGGLLYGLIAASQSVEAGAGALSVLLVVLCLTVLMAVIGGAGVGLGIAAAAWFFGSSWLASTAGGALGGLLVGAVVKLLGIDAFNLLFGQSPGDITGAVEGVILGGAVGLGAWLAVTRAGQVSGARIVSVAALAGAMAGMAIALLNGRLMVGSLDLLARQFSGSRLRLDPFGRLFGEEGFGQITQLVTGGLEGALFAACIVGAILLAAARSQAQSGRTIHSTSL